MRSTERPDLEASPADRIYQVVERRGAVDPQTVRERLEVDHRQFDHAVSRLREEGYLEETAGTLRIALDAGADATYSQYGVEYTIRPAREEDLGGIVKVMRRISDEKTYVVAESVAERLLHDHAVVRHNEVESRLFFVAEADGGVVGWAHLDTASIETMHHVARQTIGVTEPYRGYGIGSRLLARGLEWAADHEFRKLYNSVPATNEGAIGFLESHGYEIEAVRPDHYLVDGEFVDEVQMAIHPTEAMAGSDGAVTTAWNTSARLSKAGEHLLEALAAAESETVRYHLREALQYLQFAREDPRLR